MPSGERGSGDHGWRWSVSLRACCDVACRHLPRVRSSARFCEGVKPQVRTALGWVLRGRTPGMKTPPPCCVGPGLPRACRSAWRTCGGGGLGSWPEAIFSPASRGNFLSVRWACDNTFLPSNPTTVSVGSREFTSEVHTAWPSTAAPCLAGSRRGGPSGPSIVPGQLW